MKSAPIYLLSCSLISGFVADLGAQQVAPELNTYDWHASVSVNGKNNNAQFIVPQWVYEKSRHPQLADVALFNPKGQLTTFAFAEIGERRKAKNYDVSTALPPVWTEAVNSYPTSNVSTHDNKNITLTRDSEYTGGRYETPIVLASTVFNLNQEPPAINTLRSTPRILASADTHQQNHGERYELRYEWKLDGKPGRQAGDWIFQSSGAIAPDRIALHFNEYGVVFPATIGEYRANPTAWQFSPILNATFYRLRRDNSEVTSGYVHVRPRHVSTWVVRNLSPNLADVAPQLILRWRPVRLVFLVNQPGIYILAVGHKDNTQRSAVLNQVAPHLEEKDYSELQEVVLSSPTKNGAATNDQSAESMDWDAGQKRKWFLWSILFLGVFTLSFLTYRIFLQMKNGDTKKND